MEGGGGEKNKEGEGSCKRKRGGQRKVLGDVGETRCFSPTDRSASMWRVVFADYKCQILQCAQCTLHCCKSLTIVKRVVHLVRNGFFFCNWPKPQ